MEQIGLEKLLKFKVKDVMTSEVIAIDKDVNASDAAKLMKEKKVGGILVKKDGKVVGILTERDLVRRVIAEDKDPADVKVSEIMSKPVVVIKEDADLETAVEAMVKNGIRRLPVISKNKMLVGIVTATDLAKALAVEYKLENMFFNALARVRPPPSEMYG